MTPLSYPISDAVYIVVVIFIPMIPVPIDLEVSIHSIMNNRVVPITYYTVFYQIMIEF